MEPNTTPAVPGGTNDTTVAPAMEVSGEALACFPLYILQKYGKEQYRLWLKALPPASRAIYNVPLDKKAWYPLEAALADPTILLCNMFSNKSIRGAWDCGRYSAEYGLRGIRKILAKLSSPQLLIQKATSIMQDYYRPSNLTVVSQEEYQVVVRITEFPRIDRYIEHRIAGWMERALQICGCKHVTIQITASLVDNAPYTEYKMTWKKY